jgi:hypothetical protein
MSSRPLTDPLTTPITLRGASTDDRTALCRLAALDSTSVPLAPLMMGEVDGELRAAVSIADGTAIADPFYPTAHIVALLRTHAAVRTRRSDRRPRLSLRYRLGWGRPKRSGIEAGAWLRRWRGPGRRRRRVARGLGLATSLTER